MFQVAGGAVGLGLATTLFTIRSEDRVSSDIEALGLNPSGRDVDVIHGILAGTDSGTQAVADFSGATADKVLEVVRDSFVSGAQFSFRIVAAIALVGLTIAALGVRPSPPARSAEPA
jgi:hypothetical protein